MASRIIWLHVRQSHVVSICPPPFTPERRSLYVVQTGLRLTVRLPQPPDCWNYRCITPHPGKDCLLMHTHVQVGTSQMFSDLSRDAIQKARYTAPRLSHLSNAAPTSWPGRSRDLSQSLGFSLRVLVLDFRVIVQALPSAVQKKNVPDIVTLLSVSFYVG